MPPGDDDYPGIWQTLNTTTTFFERYRGDLERREAAERRGERLRARSPAPLGVMDAEQAEQRWESFLARVRDDSVRACPPSHLVS